jgi:L-ascorbate metabolism protein UlaG (beta-lactamase superfamily)
LPGAFILFETNSGARRDAPTSKEKQILPPDPPKAGVNQFEKFIRGGPTIYDTGDTAFFSDMALVSNYNKIDIMLVRIGDHFTMGPICAADAVKLVDPRMVIPMPYGTFQVLTGTPEELDGEMKARGVKTKLRVMKIGETISL